MTDQTITTFEKELAELKQKAVPVVWTSLEGNIGNVVLDFQQSNIEKLKLEIGGLEASLESCNKEKAPQDWASLQNSLADAIHALGQQETDDSIEILNESMEAYKNVLMLWRRQDMPLAWASILNNIGVIFLLQGERSNGPHSLKKAISAFNNALMVRTVDEVPMEWAITQNNVGVSLQILAEIEKNDQLLEESIIVFENALKKINKETSPLGWLTVMGNLCASQRNMANKRNDSELAKKVVDNSESIVEFLSNANNTNYLDLAKKEKEKSLELLEKLG